MSSILTDEHTKEALHPFLLSDLKEGLIVSLYDWIEMYYGRTRIEIDAWATLISELKWFEDPIIQQALINFCTTKAETKRYKPFVAISNRILELAPGVLPGVPAKGCYPVDDICFATTASNDVLPIPEHGLLAARRRPDIGAMRRAQVPNFKAGERMGWTHFLSYTEVKAQKDLRRPLDVMRASRGLSSTDDWEKAHPKQVSLSC